MTLTVWVKRLIVVKVSEETIRNILCRDSLIADEFVKFQVILKPIILLTLF